MHFFPGPKYMIKIVRHIKRAKGIPFMLWHARHEIYHILLGLVWAWFLREWWGEFNRVWIAIAVIGSVFPDIEHLRYWFGYGRQDDYSQQIIHFIKTGQWRNLWLYIENGHKYSTSLAYHNIYFVLILFGIALLASIFEWRKSVIFIGSMIIHYLFDIADDYVTLGYVNHNWKRWGRAKEL